MFFSKMKEKQQKAYRVKSNDEVLLTTLLSMFAYKDLPEELMERTNYGEEILLMHGAVGVWNFKNTLSASGDKSYDDKWIFSEVQFQGAPDVYGVGCDLIATTENGVCKEFKGWRENPDIQVIFNNSSWSPDVNIGKTSDILTEIETSEKLQVIFSRLYPIPIAKNTKVQKAIESAITNMLNGKIATVLDEDSLSKYISDATKEAIECISITDPDKVQFLQYLSSFHDDVMRRFYGIYGLDGGSNTKMAQQSVEEVDRNTEASLVLPHDMLYWRTVGIQGCNKKFGWNGQVSFSECWAQREESNFDDEFKKTDEEINDDSIGVDNSEPLPEDGGPSGAPSDSEEEKPEGETVKVEVNINTDGEAKEEEEEKKKEDDDDETE